MSEKVRVLKTETAALGGDAADDVDYPAPANPIEDAFEAVRYYLQKDGGPGIDSAVYVDRTGDDLRLVDTSASVLLKQVLTDQGRYKAPVKAASLANLTLSGTQTIDAISCGVGDRVLAKNQSVGGENGIYVVASGAWTRATDMDSAGDLPTGVFIFVEQGTINGDTFWAFTTDGAITLGTTALVFQVVGTGLSSATPTSITTAAAATGVSIRRSRDDHSHDLGANCVLDANFRQSVALSVLGRSANSTGNITDISTTNGSGAVLRESGGVLGFGTIAAAGLASDAVTTVKVLDANITYAKIQNVGARSIFGRSANSGGVGADIAGAGAATYLNDNGTSLAFRAIPNATTSVPGLMSDTDKVKLDGLGSGSNKVVRAATTANITLSGAQTIDGISIIATDRVLVKAQTTGAENGIYACAAGAWTRATDFDADAEAIGGTLIVVQEGTLNADTIWELTNNGTVVVGTTAMTFDCLAAPSSAATPAAIGAATTGTSLKRSRDDHVHNIANGTVTDAMLANQGARSIKGRSANSSGVPADISGGGAGQVLHDDGTTLAFRAISYLAYDKLFDADTMENPNSSDWPVNVLAPAVADGTNAAEVARAMDDTTEGGFGLSVMIPESATNIIFDFTYWPNTAPGATRTAGLKAYARRITTNVALAAFVTKTMTDLSIPNNRRPQVQSMTFALSAWSSTLVAGELVKFEITRIAPSAGTNLTGDLYMRAVRVRFS